MREQHIVGVLKQIHVTLLQAGFRLREFFESPIESLSDRGLEVFRLLGQGKGVRHIAEQLEVTVATVNSFRNRIKEKLGLKSSTEVMLRAIQWAREETSA